MFINNHRRRIDKTPIVELCYVDLKIETLLTLKGSTDKLNTKEWCAATLRSVGNVAETCGLFGERMDPFDLGKFAHVI